MQTNPIIPWTPFIPHKPTPKQLAFLMLPHEEAFYGGALGGGKSDVGLMGALQYVDTPYFSALILRRQLTDLKQQAALLNRAHEWLDDWCRAGIVKYIPGEHAFEWQNKARLSFGFLGDIGTEERYQSAEFQYIFIDEVLQHHPYHYQYMFSRIRRTKCPHHEGHLDDNGEPAPLPHDFGCVHCQRYAPLSRVPLKMRSAGNPGGMSHAFFMERFRIEKNSSGHWVGLNPEAPFIQATLYDNPYLDRKEYERMLDKMDYTTRMRLKYGEWGAVDDARFKSSWICTYERRGENYILTYRDGTRRQWQLWDMIIFTVIDPAASVREGIAGAVFVKNKLPSYTVAGTFGVTPLGELLWLDLYRSQAEAPEILHQVKAICRKHRPGFVLFERNQNVALAQFMASVGIPVRPLWQYIDKIQNSVTAQLRMEQGRVFLPRDGDVEWIKSLKNELFIWTGHPNEIDDQVDVLSNAAQMVTILAGEDQFDSSIGGEDEGPIAIFPSFSSPI